MRTAAICPTCAVYTNAACIIYDGDRLTNLDVNPLDALDVILGKINVAIEPLEGDGPPTGVPVYVGQYYIDTTNDILYIGLGTSSSNWGTVGTIITTTTTSTTSTTSTSTTLP